MTSTLYKEYCEPKYGLLDGKIYAVRDYWTYYTTGIETLVLTNPDLFNVTERKTGEQPEQITFDVYGDENLADYFVAINNENYIWSLPYDLDMFIDAVEFRFRYLKQLMRDRIQIISEDPEGYDHEYNDVGTICKSKIQTDVQIQDTKARTCVIPNPDKLTTVKRKIKLYLKNRKVD